MSATRSRDRTPFALLELGAAAMLVWASLLPWFLREGTDHLDAWHAVDGGVLIVLSPMVAVATTLVGVFLDGRSKWATPIAFALACLFPLYYLRDPGAIDYVGRYTITSEYGLWLEAAAALAGLGVALADLRFAGPSTVISRVVGEPPMIGYAVAAVAVLFIGQAFVAQASQTSGALAFSVGTVVLVAVALAAPMWPIRLLVAVLMVGLSGVWFMADSAPLAVGAGLVFVAGVVVMLARRRMRRHSPASQSRAA